MWLAYVIAIVIWHDVHKIAAVQKMDMQQCWMKTSIDGCFLENTEHIFCKVCTLDQFVVNHIIMSLSGPTVVCHIVVQ